jgi:hypothetical protein
MEPVAGFVTYSVGFFVYLYQESECEAFKTLGYISLPSPRMRNFGQLGLELLCSIVTSFVKTVLLYTCHLWYISNSNKNLLSQTGIPHRVCNWREWNTRICSDWVLHVFLVCFVDLVFFIPSSVWRRSFIKDMFLLRCSRGERLWFCTVGFEICGGHY